VCLLVHATEKSRKKSSLVKKDQEQRKKTEKVKKKVKESAEKERTFFRKSKENSWRTLSVLIARARPGSFLRV
jgi:hypothetical protein